MQGDQMRAAIHRHGSELGPDTLAAVIRLYEDEQRERLGAWPASAIDVEYGPDPRHRLDIYSPKIEGPWPVLVFVHGGGFVKGDKGDTESWPNAAVGRMAAERDFLGIVVNYRLAPDNGWPAGAHDVAAAVDWLKANAAAHNGDPTRIVLMGTSAGAVHIVGYLKLRPQAEHEICGAVLMSGLYGYTPLDDRDTLYYGDQTLYSERMPLDAVASTMLPLFIACAEFDPPRFQAEFLSLTQDRLARHGTISRSYIASGHNHYSVAMHLGTSDTRLADEIFNFVREATQP